MNNYMQRIFEILLYHVFYLYIYFIMFIELLLCMKHVAQSTKKLIAQNSLIFTKTPLKFLSISLIAEKKIWQLCRGDGDQDPVASEEV